jgi:hypothetical protein
VREEGLGESERGGGGREREKIRDSEREGGREGDSERGGRETER